MPTMSDRCHAEQVDECRRLHSMATQLAMAGIVYFIGLALYAAHRRTELRERFNIAGAQHSCCEGGAVRDFMLKCRMFVHTAPVATDAGTPVLPRCLRTMSRPAADLRSACLLHRQQVWRLLRLVLVPRDGPVPGDTHAGRQQRRGWRLARPQSTVRGCCPVHRDHAAQGHRDDHA